VSGDVAVQDYACALSGQKNAKHSVNFDFAAKDHEKLDKFP
jgi:hypothetical protein